jgi:hypothetical protein
MYRFFLRANGNVECAKADFLAFLLPERILLFARHCVEDDGSGAPNEPKVGKIPSQTEQNIRASDH